MPVAQEGAGGLALTRTTLGALDVNRLPAPFREQPSLALARFEGRLRDQERARGLFAVRSGPLPLKRMHLADAVGLSKVHVMRALNTCTSRVSPR